MVGLGDWIWTWLLRAHEITSLSAMHLSARGYSHGGGWYFSVLVVFDVGSDDDGIGVESPMFLAMGMTRVVLMRVKLGRGTDGGREDADK